MFEAKMESLLPDIWFAPKHFESKALYERLAVRFIKRYVPTGGDFVRSRYGIRIVDIRGNLDSLSQFERCTRKLEAVQVLAFIGFLSWSAWRAITGRTTLADFGIAILIYTLLILSPAMRQRYNPATGTCGHAAVDGPATAFWGRCPD